MKLLLFIVALLSASSLQAQTEPSTEAAQNSSPAKQNPPPLDPKNMDTSVKPQDDFYLYANGGWLKRNPVPPEYSRWGSFTELEEKNNEALHKIAEKAANTHVDANAAPEVQKVGDYYASGMDEKTIEAARTKPLEDELKRIDCNQRSRRSA
jgi:putative endopeptidase